GLVLGGDVDPVVALGAGEDLGGLPLVLGQGTVRHVGPFNRVGVAGVLLRGGQVVAQRQVVGRLGLAGRPGAGLFPVGRRLGGAEPAPASGTAFAAASMLSGRPLTNGSLSRPTRGSSKTHRPFHLYGWMTSREF